MDKMWHWCLACCALSAAVVALLVAGCASVSVDANQQQRAVKPDFIFVQNFAVRPQDVQIDQGIASQVALETGMTDQTDDEVKLGRSAATMLATKLVAALREAGIPAYREGDNVKPTARTAIVAGRFVTIDAGNRTTRVLLGFGLGRTELRTRVVVYQNGQVIAEGDTRTGSAPRPGIGVSLGTGAIAGSIGTAAVSGGAAAGASELFLSTIEADAQRTANELAKRIVAAYQARGWLAQ